jgi:site-specific recombinase XerD
MNLTEEMKKSLHRIFSFVYEHTKVMSIGFIDEKICCSYLKFHHSKNFEEATFIEALKDIKNFNYFVHHIKEYRNAPNIKLSLKNYSFWLKLDE